VHTLARLSCRINDCCPMLPANALIFRYLMHCVTRVGEGHALGFVSGIGSVVKLGGVEAVGPGGFQSAEISHGGGPQAGLYGGYGGHGVVVPPWRWGIGRALVWFSLGDLRRFARSERSATHSPSENTLCRKTSQGQKLSPDRPATTPCSRPSSVQGPLAGRLRVRFPAKPATTAGV